VMMTDLWLAESGIAYHSKQSESQVQISEDNRYVPTFLSFCSFGVLDRWVEMRLVVVVVVLVVVEEAG